MASHVVYRCVSVVLNDCCALVIDFTPHLLLPVHNLPPSAGPVSWTADMMSGWPENKCLGEKALLVVY